MPTLSEFKFGTFFLMSPEQFYSVGFFGEERSIPSRKGRRIARTSADLLLSETVLPEEKSIKRPG